MARFTLIHLLQEENKDLKLEADSALKTIKNSIRYVNLMT